MEQPPEFQVKSTPNLVCKLHKAIYGLKQAPRAWFEKLCGALLSFGFISAKSDQSLFIKITPLHQICLLVYVDDILITGSDHEAITSLINNLTKIFALKDLGELNYFLGIQISKLPNGSIHLSQNKYVAGLLSRAKMASAKGLKTPMTSG